MPTEPAGWTTRERTLAATAGVIAIIIVVLIGVALLPRDVDAQRAATDPDPTSTALASSAASRSTPIPASTSPPSVASPTPTSIPADGFTVDGLAELSAFRFTIEMEGSGANSPLMPIEGRVEVSGVVTTDPEAIDIVISNFVGPGSSLRMVAIGSEAWVDDGSGTLVPVSGAEADSARRAIERYQPENLFASAIGELPSDAILVGTTTRAGVAVEEYRIDQTTVEGVGAELLMEGSFAIHADLRVPVWTEVRFTSVADPSGTFRVSFDILDLNAPNLVIERP